MKWLFLLIFLNALTAHAGAPACREAYRALTAPQAVSKAIKFIFKEGQPSADYHALLSSVKPGEFLDFGQGAVFQVKKRIDGDLGETTFVFETTEGDVLRVPKAFSNPAQTFGREGEKFGIYFHFIDSFVQVHSELKRDSVPVV